MALRLQVGELVGIFPNSGSVSPWATRQAFTASSSFTVRTHRILISCPEFSPCRAAAHTTLYFIQPDISLALAFGSYDFWESVICEIRICRVRLTVNLMKDSTGSSARAWRSRASRGYSTVTTRDCFGGGGACTEEAGVGALSPEPTARERSFIGSNSRGRGGVLAAEWVKPQELAPQVAEKR